MNYNIIQTGSTGNAVIIDGTILIDCGVPFIKLKHYFRNLKIVFITHEHQDHFKKATVKKLASERPTLRFACGKYLVDKLLKCGVKASNIDVLDIGIKYNYKTFQIIPIQLYHNVPNIGFRIFIDDKKIFYATDTEHLEGITAKDYDLYMIEANYTEDDLKRRMIEKKEAGEYSYEMDASQRHLSKEQADDFIITQGGLNSRYVYLHQHVEKDRVIKVDTM